MTPKCYSISAVIIARNEEATIERVIQESIQVLPILTDEYEILINDDASTDRTSQILDKLSRKFHFINVFHQKRPLGITGGLEFLYRKASKDLIFVNSGDGQYTIKDLPKMVKEINVGYDLIIGERKRKIQYNLIRKIVSFCFSFLPKILFGVNLYDPGSNKLYKRNVLQETTPISKSVFSEAERIIRAYGAGFKVSAVKINYFARKKGTSSAIRPQILFHSFIDILRLFLLLKIAKLSHLSVLFLNLLIILMINQFILQPITNNGVALDDWNNLTLFHLSGGIKNLLLSLMSEKSPPFGNLYFGQTLSIGFLETIFRLDFDKYIQFNILLKIITTLSIYPLVFILFRSKLIASLSVLLFAISFISAGPLVYMALGNEYIAVTLLLISLAIYYKIIAKHSTLLLLLGTLLYNFAFLLSVIRIFPTIILIIIFEVILFLVRFKQKSYHPMLRIICFIFIPFLVSTFVIKGVNSLSNIISLIDFLKKGNLFLILYPFEAYGNSILPLSALHQLGNISLESLSKYLYSLYTGPAIKYLIIIAIFSPLLSKYPLKFNLTVDILNFAAYAMIFFLATNHLTLLKSQLPPYDPIPFNSSLQGAILGATILTLIIMLFREWILHRNRSNYIIPYLVAGALLSFGYMFIIWLSLGTNFPYGGGVHRYFVISAIFNSIFLSSLVVLMVKNSKNSLTQGLSISISIILCITLFVTARNEIAHHFNSIKDTGNNLEAQQLMQNKALHLLPNDKKNIFVYIEFNDTDKVRQYWNKAFDPYNFVTWYRVRRSYYLLNRSIDGCIAVIYRRDQIKEAAVMVNNQEGFIPNVDCDYKFFPKDSFYSLKLEPALVSDITSQVLTDIDFKETQIK